MPVPNGVITYWSAAEKEIVLLGVWNDLLTKYCKVEIRPAK